MLEAQIWDPLDGRIPLLHVAVELSEEQLLCLCVLWQRLDGLPVLKGAVPQLDMTLNEGISAFKSLQVHP